MPAVLRKYHLLVMFALCLAIFAPYIVTGNGYFNWGDISFPFVPWRAIERDVYVWDYQTIPGRSPTYQGFLPLKTLIFILESAGIPLPAINHSVVVLPYILQSLGMYYLVASLIDNRFSKPRDASRDDKNYEYRVRIPALMAACFAVINPSMVWWDTHLSLALAGMTLSLLFFIRGMHDRTNKNLVLLAASTLLLASNPLIFAVTVSIALFFWIAYHVVVKSVPSRKEVAFVSKSAVMILSFNLFWLLPLLHSFTYADTIYQFTNPTFSQSSESILQRNSSVSTFSNIFRLFFPFAIWDSVSQQFPIISIAAAVPITIAIMGILLSRHIIGYVIFTIVYLVVVLFATGLRYDSFNFVFRFLWENLNIFRVFRDVGYFYFVGAAFLSILFGLGLAALLRNDVFNRMKQWKRNAAVIIISAALLVSGAHVFIADQKHNWPTHYPDMVIPEDYHRLTQVVKGDDHPEQRLLVLPWSDKNINYIWNPVSKPAMTDIVYEFAPVPVIGTQVGASPTGLYAEVLAALRTSDQLERAAQYLGATSTKYILVHKDGIVSGFPTYLREADKYSDILSKRPDLFTKIEGFSNFDLFYLNDKYVKPPITGYAAVSATALTFNEETTAELAGEKYALKLPFTISFWINNSGNEPSHIILAKIADTDSANRNVAFDLVVNDNKQPGKLKTALYSGTLYSQLSPASGYWHHVTLVAGEKSLKLYVNGLVRDSHQMSGTAASKEDNEKYGFIYVGHDPGNTTKPFQGQLLGMTVIDDELRDSDVYELFASGPLSTPRYPSTVYQSLLTTKESLNDMVVNNEAFVSTNLISNSLIISKQQEQSYTFVNPIEHTLSYDGTDRAFIFMNERYDAGWLAHAESGGIVSHFENSGLNVWEIEGPAHITITYKHQWIIPTSFSASLALSAALTILFLCFQRRLNTYIKRNNSTVVPEKNNIQEFWAGNVPGKDENLKGAQIGTKEFIEQYREIRQYTEPFRIPIFDSISNKNSTCLEVGCGMGMDLIELAARNAYTIGVDLSFENAFLAARSLKALGLKGSIIVADAENLPFNNESFDLVYSYGVLHHTPNTLKAIDGIHRITKKGSSVCVMLYHQGLTYYLIMIVKGILGLQLLKYSPEELFSKHYDNTPLSKAYSARDMKQMFKNFNSLATQVYSFGGVRRNKKLRFIWFFYGNKFLQRKIGSFIYIFGKK